MSSRNRNRRRSRWHQQQKQKRTSLLTRIFRNRYTGSNWVSLADVLTNTREIFYAWSHRLGPGSRVIWRDGRPVGHTTSWRGPR
jgi:hypothetical protein